MIWGDYCWHTWLLDTDTDDTDDTDMDIWTCMCTLHWLIIYMDTDDMDMDIALFETWLQELNRKEELWCEWWRAVKKASQSSFMDVSILVNAQSGPSFHHPFIFEFNFQDQEVKRLEWWGTFLLLVIFIFYTSQHPHYVEAWFSQEYLNGSDFGTPPCCGRMWDDDDETTCSCKYQSQAFSCF